MYPQSTHARPHARQEPPIADQWRRAPVWVKVWVMVLISKTIAVNWIMKVWLSYAILPPKMWTRPNAIKGENVGTHKI